jgi:hypothetical protein
VGEGHVRARHEHVGAGQLVGRGAGAVLERGGGPDERRERVERQVERVLVGAHERLEERRRATVVDPALVEPQRLLAVLLVEALHAAPLVGRELLGLGRGELAGDGAP